MKSNKLLQKMINNPKGDWTPSNIKTIVTAYNFKLRQQGTSHAVLTNHKGNHLTIPMKKPIKAIYIKKFIEFIQE